MDMELRTQNQVNPEVVEEDFGDLIIDDWWRPLKAKETTNQLSQATEAKNTKGCDVNRPS